MVFKGYTKRDTSIIKGFGILCIVLHNYFHWRPPSPGENEFNFLSERVTAFFTLLGDNPGEFINLIFSYLGHYGVQLFIFISGFGLAMSMMQHPRTWESCVVSKLKKLYPLLLIGILFFILSYMVIYMKQIGFYEKTEIKRKLLLIHTLIPNSGMSVNGPWWFFGLIFQLYLLFPYLYKSICKWRWKAFAVLCLISYVLIFLFRYVYTRHNGELIMMNAPGHIPEFCLGILLACSKDKRINVLWFVLAVALFCLGNCYEMFYPFTFLSLTVMMVFAYQWLKSIPINKAVISRPLAYFGDISMALFATHAVFRDPIIKISWTDTGALWFLWTGFIYLLIAWGVAVAAKVLYDYIESKLDKIKIRENRLTHVIGIVCQVAIVVSFAYVLVKFG